MTMQMSEMMKALPVLKKLNEEGMLAEAEFDFQPFRVTEQGRQDVHWLFRPEESGACGAAIVRYSAGGNVLAHEHTGFEIAFILEGEMMTNQGVLRKGDLMCVSPGTSHSFWSETGGMALMIWEKPPLVIDVE